MTDLESAYIRKSQELFTAANEWATLRQAAIEAFMTQNHPGVQCVMSVEKDNVLSLEVVFPGIERERSNQLGCEINAYLKQLDEKAGR